MLLSCLAASAIAVPVSGCSLLVDSGGLTGAGASDGQPDSSAGEDAADASDDGGQTGIDAAAEAEAGGDTASPESGAGFCAASAHDFCDDFDGPPLAQKWTEVVTEAGTVTLTGDKSVSAPNALRVQLQAGAPDYKSAAPFQMLTSPSASYHLEASVLVLDKSDQGSVEVLALSFNPPSGFTAYDVLFGISEGRYRLMEWAQETGVGDHTNHSDLATSTSFAAWRRVEIDVTLSTSGSTAVLKLDGQVAGQVELEPAPALGVRVGVGAAQVEGITGSWTILVDDVAIDAS